MGQTDDLQDRSGKIAAILEHYAEWHLRTWRKVFYTADVPKEEDNKAPEVLIDWLSEEIEKGALDESTTQHLKEIHIELSKLADSFILEALRGEKPNLVEFDNFQDVYNDLIERLKRLERDGQVANSTDSETGFRTMTVFDNDIKRELDRFSRSDKPFCLAVLQIDSFDDIEEAGTMAVKQTVLGASRSISACLRTFDDAYRYSDKDFVLCLKNTDISGANAALMRINGHIAKENATYRVEDSEYPLSVSASMTEIQVSDDPKALIERMLADVSDSALDPGSILQLQELSALQQYVKKMAD